MENMVNDTEIICEQREDEEIRPVNMVEPDSALVEVMDAEKVIFNFLHSKKVSDIRGIARELSVHLYVKDGSLKKEGHVARVFLKLREMETGGKNGLEVLRAMGHADISNVEANIRQGTGGPWRDVPNDEILNQKALRDVSISGSGASLQSDIPRARKESSLTPQKRRLHPELELDATCKDLTVHERGTDLAQRAERRKALTVSEFARLIVLIRDCDELRFAFVQTKAGLNKADLDAGRKPTDLWDKKVALIYNDPSIKPFVSIPCFCEHVVDLNYSGVALSAAKLRTEIDSFKGGFNKTMMDYRRSGQNMPGLFSFLEFKGCDFSNLRWAKEVVAGYLLGIGTGNEDLQIISMLTRSLDESGSASCEAGLGSYDWKRSSSGEKGKRNSGNGVDMTGLSNDLGSLCNVVKNHFSTAQSNTAQEYVETENIERRHKLMKLYKEASEVSGMENEDEIKAMFKKHALDVKERIEFSTPKKK